MAIRHEGTEALTGLSHEGNRGLTVSASNLKAKGAAATNPIFVCVDSMVVVWPMHKSLISKGPVSSLHSIVVMCSDAEFAFAKKINGCAGNEVVLSNPGRVQHAPGAVSIPPSSPVCYRRGSLPSTP